MFLMQYPWHWLSLVSETLPTLDLCSVLELAVTADTFVTWPRVLDFLGVKQHANGLLPCSSVRA